MNYRSDTSSAHPVFIVGCGHSGTTVVLRLLGRLGGFHALQYESNWALARDPVAKISQLEASVGGYRLVEKTPKHVFELGKIFRARPLCKVIVCYRDGRASLPSPKH